MLDETDFMHSASSDVRLMRLTSLGFLCQNNKIGYNPTVRN